jgi:hypothetical protein
MQGPVRGQPDIGRAMTAPPYGEASFLSMFMSLIDAWCKCFQAGIKGCRQLMVLDLD